MIVVKVKEIVLDQSMSPVVILVNEEETKALPIWIGPFEAHAIALGLQGVLASRPMTHDLMKSLCEQFHASISRIVVADVREGTYYAEIHLEQEGREIVIDSRPSDAIALALRSGTSLYITEKVEAYSLAMEDLIPEDQQDELKQLLEGNEDDPNKSLH